MDKLKNIGISALAGTLVSLSAAQAGGVSVSGTWELSYTNLNQEKVGGNKIGMNKNISFGASGDMSDGGAVTWSTSVAGSDSMGLSSASFAINMGGIATLAYDSGSGGYGANAVDNIIPTAWEEIDYGLTTGIADVGAVSKSVGVINLTIKAPVAGTGISISYAPRMGESAQGDGATGGKGGTKGVDVTLDLVDYNAAHFGWRFGLAAEMEIHEMTCDRQRKDAAIATSDTLHACNGKKSNPYGGTMYNTMKFGPLSLGVQATFLNPQDSGATAVMNKRSILGGAALVFGNTLSLSYGEAQDTYRYNNRNRGAVDQSSGVEGQNASAERLGDDFNEYEKIRYRGISAALNLGPVALKATRNSVDKAGEGASSQPREHSELNLSIAF